MVAAVLPGYICDSVRGSGFNCLLVYGWFVFGIVASLLVNSVVVIVCLFTFAWFVCGCVDSVF